MRLVFYFNNLPKNSNDAVRHLNKNSGTRIGTITDKIKPVEKDKIAVSLLVLLEMIGSVVSIAVAPAGAMASMKPTRLAIMGISAMAKTSRMTLVKKASTDNSEEYGAIIMEESVYQPKPDPIAPDSFSGYPSIDPIRIAPNKLPAVIAIGVKKNNAPVFFMSLKTFLFFPMSMPTKNSSKHNPMVKSVSVVA